MKLGDTWKKIKLNIAPYFKRFIWKICQAPQVYKLLSEIGSIFRPKKNDRGCNVIYTMDLGVVYSAISNSVASLKLQVRSNWHDFFTTKGMSRVLCTLAKVLDTMLKIPINNVVLIILSPYVFIIWSHISSLHCRI